MSAPNPAAEWAEAYKDIKKNHADMSIEEIERVMEEINDFSAERI